MLSSAQVSEFAENGFLVLPEFASPQQCRTLRDRAAELEATLRSDHDEITVFSTNDQSHGDDDWFLSSGDKVRGFFEEDGTHLNKIGHALHDLDPAFDQFVRGSGLAEIASDVGLADALLVQSMYIFKHPSVGGEVTWHTDHTFLWTEPRSVMGFWLGIDEATTENSCLWVIPGGHRIPVKSRFVSDGRATHTEVFDTTPYPIERAVPLETASGTLVLLDGLLPHWSDTNRSAAPRQAFTLHVVDASAHWDETNWLQRPAETPFRSF